jgi:hypothetical protein
LHTALKHPEDLCHPEFLPYDLCTVGDYLHFTAMVAPRRLLLIYNAKDPLSFPSDRTLSPLANFAAAFYNLCGARSNLHWFINEQSTEHTFDQANRTSFYRELGRAIGANGPSWQDAELPCESELRTPEDLRVAMPATNETFHSLALRLSAKVPIEQDEPWRASRKVRWLAEQRSMLRDLVRAKDYTVEAEPLAVSEAGPTKLQSWRLRFGADWTTPRDWTVPLVELTRGTPKATALVIADQGRSSLAATVEQMLSRGLRVLAADLTGFGEARFGRSDHLLALFIAALGDRPLGVQAGEVAAIARWAESKFQNGPVVVASHGPRTGLIALIAGSLEESAIGGIESHGAWTSLKQLISEDLSVEIAPEAFCPDLLERFDVPQLEGLILPRPVIRNPAK